MTDRKANRIKRRKRRRRKQLLALALLLLFICAVAGSVGSCHREAKAEKTAILEEAENYALQYDYDKAENTLLKVKKAEKDKAVAKKMEEYVRMGRRNLDGFRLWQCVFGGSTMMDDLMDPATVFDSKRPKDAYLYQL